MQQIGCRICFASACQERKQKAIEDKKKKNKSKFNIFDLANDVPGLFTKASNTQQEWAVPTIARGQCAELASQVKMQSMMMKASISRSGEERELRELPVALKHLRQTILEAWGPSSETMILKDLAQQRLCT